MMKTMMFALSCLSLVACGGANAAVRDGASTPASASPHESAADSAAGATTAGATTATSASAAGPGGTAVSAAPPASMTLEAKKEMKFAQDHFSERMRPVRERCGMNLRVDIDWASFGSDVVALKVLGTNRGIGEAAMAIGGLCRDSVGKEAITTKLKRIELRNVPGATSKKLSFSAGVLRIDGSYKDNVEGTFHSDDYTKLLEKSL